MTLPIDWIVGGGVAAALVALAVGTWLLRRRGDARIASPEEAAEAADAELVGFTTLGAVVGADGAGALAVANDGRVAVMKRSGKRIAVREVAWNAVRAGAEGIVVETGEKRFGSVGIAGVDALDVRRLSPEGLAWRGR